MGKLRFSNGAPFWFSLSWLFLAGIPAWAQSTPQTSESVSGREPLRNALGLEASVLGIGGSYAKHVGTSVMAGVGVGLGGELGIMVFEDEFSVGSYGADHVFAELLHADLFLRSSPRRWMQMELGARAAWLYHPPTEYETVFIGLQVAWLIRAGPLRLGPRLLVGHLREEAGRSAMNVGLIPIVIRYEWWW